MCPSGRAQHNPALVGRHQRSCKTREAGEEPDAVISYFSSGKRPCSPAEAVPGRNMKETPALTRPLLIPATGSTSLRKGHAFTTALCAPGARPGLKRYQGSSRLDQIADTDKSCPLKTSTTASPRRHAAGRPQRRPRGTGGHALPGPRSGRFAHQPSTRRPHLENTRWKAPLIFIYSFFFFFARSLLGEHGDLVLSPQPRRGRSGHAARRRPASPQSASCVYLPFLQHFSGAGGRQRGRGTNRWKARPAHRPPKGLKARGKERGALLSKELSIGNRC